MKVFGIIMKIVVALAAVAGVIYLAATYGDKIVSWAKKLLHSGKRQKDCVCDSDFDCDCAEDDEIVADDVVAAETDFEG